MWVQEGNDSKESGDAASNHSPLFSRLYSLTPSRSKQSVTTIGIPMKTASADPNPSQPQKSASNMNVTADEKDEESFESPRESPVPPLKSVFTPPISPALFLQNMKSTDGDQATATKEEEEENEDEDIPMFTTDDVNEGETHSNAPDDGLWDLAIIGKKLNIPSMSGYQFDDCPIHNNDDDNDGDDPMGDNQDCKEEKEEKDVDFEYYIPKAFDGLDIERASEWERCIEFTQRNALLIVELYSTTFGASDVMYPFIDEILHNTASGNIKFIRLRLDKMNELDEIKQVITNHASFASSPIPMYIFIKNGMKLGELYGTNVAEFERLMGQYSQNEPQRPQTAPTKYSSILTQRPQSSFSYTSSPVGNKENRSINANANASVQSASRVENIRNLIKDLDVNLYQTTRLSKNTSLRSTPVNELSEDFSV